MNCFPLKWTVWHNRLAMATMTATKITAFEAEAVVRSDDEASRAATLDLLLADLRPSMVIAAPIELADGRPLLAAGTMINAVTLERVRNHAKLNGVREPIRVYDPRPEGARTTKERGRP